MRKTAIFLFVLMLVMAACGGDGGDGGDGATPAEAGQGGDAANGETVYLNTCASCHGADALGIQGLGKQLADSSFFESTSEGDLYTLIVEGRGSDHPDNDTGVAMPPKGGNPSLSDASIADVIAYLKTLQ
ncbi:MAG: cytochrome c [Acidimicrobiia bacterium]|nr:cytochrome c [Acidimicrobiia bacterium]